MKKEREKKGTKLHVQFYIQQRYDDGDDDGLSRCEKYTGERWKKKGKVGVMGQVNKDKIHC